MVFCMFYLGEIYSPNCRLEHAYTASKSGCVYGVSGMFYLGNHAYTPNCRPEHAYSVSKSGCVRCFWHVLQWGIMHIHLLTELQTCVLSFKIRRCVVLLACSILGNHAYAYTHRISDLNMRTSHSASKSGGV